MPKFFLRMADADVHRYLKLFTFMPLEDLEALMIKHWKAPSKRAAQHKLGREVLELVHGAQVAKEAERKHRSMFKRPSSSPNGPYHANTNEIRQPSDLNRMNSDLSAERLLAHNVTLPRSIVNIQPLSKILYYAGIVPSRSNGYRLLVEKGVYVGSRSASTDTMEDQVNFVQAENWSGAELHKYIIGEDTLILRAGKWKLKIIKIINDDEFDAQSQDASWWDGWKAIKEANNSIDHRS